MKWEEEYERIDKAEHGSGGRGTLLRVQSKRAVDGVVLALKLFRDGAGDAATVLGRRRRAFEEVNALRSLNHVGIPKVLGSNISRDVVEAAVEKLWIVEELVEGEQLEARRGKKTGLGTALVLIDQLLEILHHCHERGVVHRDVKPDNIIVSDDDALTLIDFGQCFRLERSDVLTDNHDEVMGNRFLVLPELSHPSDESAGREPAADVAFAVGILYFLLTGSYPRQLSDAAGRMPHEAAPPPAVERAVDEELARLFARGFQYVPKMRFESVAQLQHALARVREPPGSGLAIEQVAERARRNLENRGDIAEKLSRDAFHRARTAAVGDSVRLMNEALRGMKGILTPRSGISAGSSPLGTTHQAVAVKNEMRGGELYIALEIDRRPIHRVDVRYAVRPHGETHVFPVPEADWLTLGSYDVEELLKDPARVAQDVARVWMKAIGDWTQQL